MIHTTYAQVFAAQHRASRLGHTVDATTVHAAIEAARAAHASGLPLVHAVAAAAAVLYPVPTRASGTDGRAMEATMNVLMSADRVERLGISVAMVVGTESTNAKIKRQRRERLKG